MEEFFFVLKTALFSALVLLALQFKVGGSSLEELAETRIYHSRIGSELQSVARGAVNAGHDGWAWIKYQAQDKIGSSSSSSRASDESSAREIRRERSVRSRPRNEDLD